MPADVVLQEAMLEMYGLAGYSPYLEFSKRTGEFVVTVSLRINLGRRDGTRRVVGRDSKSADVALLKAYQALYEIPDGGYLESTHNGSKWKFDPETEGWMRIEDV